jgi:hypothetical protein
MNNYIALIVGAFTRWLLHGFNTKYKEELGESKHFNSSDEYYSYQRKTRYIGYITITVLVIILGSFLS